MEHIKSQTEDILYKLYKIAVFIRTVTNYCPVDFRKTSQVWKSTISMRDSRREDNFTVNDRAN